MSDVYERLAERLDQLPLGFPSTDDGLELKILRKIYTPEDAEMTLNLSPFPETAEAIAERLGKPAEDIEVVLYNMAKKGQIGIQKVSGQWVYVMAAFAPGIYEYQMMVRPDKEFTALFEAYFPTLIKVLGAHRPAIARTIPVNKQIDAGTQVQRYEDVRKMTEQAKSFYVVECQCRKERALEGHPCSHTLENCVSFSTEENAYDDYPLGGRTISKEEALGILDKAEEDGLVHNGLLNVKEGQAAICNCCPCCCGLLRGMKEHGAPYVMARSNFVAFIDQDTCSECGDCAEERCPVEAIAEDDGAYTVLQDLCIGCGVCTVTCPTESIALVQRPDSEQNQPPDNMVDWSMERAASRGIELG